MLPRILFYGNPIEPRRVIMALAKYVLVSGNRNVTAAQVKFICEVLDKEKLDDTTIIIHGGCRGVDTVANDWAKSHGIATIAFPPNGCLKEDYLSRNRGMVEMCNRVVAFPSYSMSRGTMYTIRYAQKLGKPVKVFDIDEIRMVVSSGS
jgi:predicted Rossmann fold nucleotide-binding protein DprA/Smf involved in DNA uptake